MAYDEGLATRIREAIGNRSGGVTKNGARPAAGAEPGAAVRWVAEDLAVRCRCAGW